MKKFGHLLLSLLFLQTCFMPLSATNTFEIKNGDFYRNGEVVYLRSGEFHYSRVPHEYWRHRLKMLKAMGLNTVSTYVFWNFHEAQPGVWDFTGDRDLAQFIRTADEEGLMVILRPGPYICGEWEYGGFPWWLQNVEGLKVRQNNTQFLAYTKKYFQRLYQEVGSLQCTKGGPIIMVQCENEFGSFVNMGGTGISNTEHKKYVTAIRDLLVETGFDAPLYTADAREWSKEGAVDTSVLPTINGGGVGNLSQINSLKSAVNRLHNNQGPYMIAEFYPGWLDHWGEAFANGSDGNSLGNQVDSMMKYKVSYNFYMLFGGTHFAFTAGANYNKSSNKDIQPDMTSYDYAAPMSEAGWNTAKYDAIRSHIVKTLGTTETVPAVPARIKVAAIAGGLKLTQMANVLAYANTLTPVEGDQPKTFEELNQGYGYVLYQRHFEKADSGALLVNGLRDYAVVYLDGKRVGILNRAINKYGLDIKIPANSTLQLLVENMGRINFGAEILNNTKGIISPVTLNGTAITGNWKSTRLPMDQQPDLTKWTGLSMDNTIANREMVKNQPVMYSGTFNVTDTADVFLNMAPFAKGIVFINGHNLGRYWYIGPQQTLYVPGCWLKKGENTVVVFDQINDAPQTTVPTTVTPVLTKLVSSNRGERDLTSGEVDILTMPQLSNDQVSHWYKMYTPNRGSRYPTSSGDNTDLVGQTSASTKAAQWKFVDRGDGSFDIVNRADSCYISPVAEYNTALKTTKTRPSSGWKFKATADEGQYAITSGSVQINQTPNQDLGFKVYNWGNGNNLTDDGCRYAFIYIGAITTSITETTTTERPSISVVNGKIEISGNPDDVIIRALDGHVVTSTLIPGIYFITVGNTTYKYLFK